MADAESEVDGRERDVLENLNAFLSGCGDTKPAQPMNNIDKIRCAIVLLQSLPCARHAVLEQLCGAFHESTHKFMVEMERKAQLGGSGIIPEVVDADLDNALHSICDVVSDFVNTNPSSWALLICEWCLNLLGDLISKFDQKRGVSLTLSFSEGFHKWMSFPPIQMLMGIAILCCSKLVVNDSDNCMETLLQMSIKYSPHLDWVVAHIVSHFHDIIVKKLLNTALRDYANTLGDESEEKSILVSTIVQVLSYLSIQFAGEIKTHLLALFHASLSKDSVDEKEKKEQLATIPFLLHIASLSPELLKGTLTDFVEVLPPNVLVQLYEQSVCRSELYNKQSSLIPALVDIITNIETGAYSIFLFLLDNCCHDTDKVDGMELPDPHPEVQKACTYIMEGLLLKLQDVTTHRHKLFTQKATIAPLVATTTESAFLLEMSSYTIKLTKLLLQAEGKRRGWMFRMLVLVCVHCGESTSVQMLNFILMHSKTNETLNLFVQMQSEIEFYHHNVLQETIKKCFTSVNHSSATVKPSMVKNIFDNLHNCIVAEKSGIFPPRCQILDIMQDHWNPLCSLISHSNHVIASKAMSLVLTIDQATYPTAAAKNMICRNVIAFLFQQLRELVDIKTSVSDVMERIKLCTQMLNKLSKDEGCRLLLIRILVESTLEKENVKLFGGKPQVKDKGSALQSNHVSLLEYNQNPHISSRLALTPSSLFFTGVIGNTNRNGLPKIQEHKTSQAWLPSSQVYMDTLVTLCKSDKETGESGPSSDHVGTPNTDHVALLLMEMLCPEMVLYCGEWPDEETLKFTIERDLKIRNTFDRNPILWWLLLLVSQGASSLCKCAPLISSLLATVMSSWEVCRDKMVTQSSELFRDTQYIMQVIVESNWLPAPISRVGSVLHLLSPREIFAITNTVWKVLKEYPPQPNPPKDELRWKQVSGSVIVQKEVIKAIFINNISTLGQHYARVFQSS